MDYGYKKLYINGALVDSKSTERKEVNCPATEKKIAEIAWGGKSDAEEALISAQNGFKYWSGLSLSERTKWMLELKDAVLKNQELLRNAIMHEMGKSWGGTWEDIEAVVNGLEWYSSAMKNHFSEVLPDYENTHRHKIIFQPAGVVVAYLAWNFPLLNVGFKLSPALAAGCSIIIKPSANSPLSAYILGEIMHEIGFPKGVVNILSGTNSEVADTLTRSQIPRVITMIGSTETGKRVISNSTSSIKHLSMELGGNAPFIVFDDADIQKAIDIGIALKYGNCGQICVSPNRFFIHRSVYENFVSEFVQRAKRIKIGFGKDYDMGPMVTKFDQQRMLKLVNDAVSKGGELLTGGRIPENFTKGYWFEPTVITNANSDMEVFKTEIFGPIAAITSFHDDDEVLNMANDTEHGLASYIFTNDINRIERFSESLEFGEVQINGVKYTIYLPHGGIKNSGIGFDCSHLALDDYLVKKRITIALNV